MARFQAYWITEDRLLLDLQSDLIDIPTRVVAPLFPLSQGPRPLTRIEPVLDVAGVAHALHTAEIAAIPAILLKGARSVDLTEYADQITRAIDMVFSGF